MTSTPGDLQARARVRLRALRRKHRDPRFRTVMGRFIEDGLLETNIEGIVRRREPVSLADALWAGTVEPRIMELLPAVLVKRQGLLRLPKELPEDVAEVIHAIRHAKPGPSFRGIPPEQYLPWVTKVGRKGRSPSVLKSFRFQHDDVLRLARLRASLPARSDTEVIRMALELIEAVTQQPSSKDAKA